MELTCVNKNAIICVMKNALGEFAGGYTNDYAIKYCNNVSCQMDKI